MNNPFVKAEKSKAKLRLAIDGPAGSGKTLTALIAATAIADGGKIALIDSESNAASIYADKFDFDTVSLTNFDPLQYVQMIHEAEKAGYAVVVIDSLSHEWYACLDMVEQTTVRNGNNIGAWRDVTPKHRALVEAILQSPIHVIATMRSKQDYAIEKDGNGKTRVQKVGLAPVQRDGMEYEFTLIGSMDQQHNMIVSKSRMDSIADAVVHKPTQEFFKQILDWLNNGAEPASMTLEEAGAFTTPGGLKFADLTTEQLKTIIERKSAIANPTLNDRRMKQAAELLLQTKVDLPL